MKRNYIPAFVMLLAGFVTCIIGLYNQYDAVRFTATLFIVLVCFCVLGCLIKGLVNHFIPVQDSEEPVKVEEESEDEADIEGNEAEEETEAEK